MTYVKINNVLYSASVHGKLHDTEWGSRSSKTIHLQMEPSTAAVLFINNIQWSIIEEYTNENEEIVQTEYDNSEYCIAGDIIDHRDGTVSIKMGKLTESEFIEILLGNN